MTIRNPVEWSADHLAQTTRAIGAAGRAVYRSNEDTEFSPPVIRRIGIADLRDALAKGVADVGAYRTDVIFLSLIYPIVGLVLARAVIHYEMLPLLFPLASGFALIGPIAAVGLYEMSRQREQGVVVSWAQAFDVLRSPSLGAIVALGLMLLAIFLLWLLTAQVIYYVTLGPEPPTSVESFLRDVFTTGAGWTMILVGVGVGFLFAVLVLAVSVASFPLLLDRKVGLPTAVLTSIRAVAANPGPMAVWGSVVASGLVLGSIPLFIGLAFVMPVLGHATWHLYRKVVAAEPLEPAPTT